MKISVRGVIEICVAVIAGIAAYCFVPPPLPELSRAEFLSEVRAGHVHSITIEDEDVITSESTARGPFRTSFDRKHDGGLPNELRALGVEVWFSRSPPGI